MDAVGAGPICVCVTGMHRTGTSLIAGLLRRHGLTLGDEADLMPGDPFNPAGYFENDRLVEINDAILRLFGGSWSSPPDFPSGWTGDLRLTSIYIDARARGGDLRSAGYPWGFKDPRAALTLPFWRTAWGELTVIVTVRNPLETALSLKRRDGMTLEAGMALWSAHYRSLLAHTTPATRIVIEYEAFFADPATAAGALLSRLPGLRELDPDVARASVRAPLRHHRATVADLRAQGASNDVLELYAQLRSEAVNPTTESVTAGANEEILTALSSLDLAIRDVHFDLQRLAAVVTRLAGEVGYIRSTDLAAIASALENQRGHELSGLASAVERVEAALQPNGRQS